MTALQRASTAKWLQGLTEQEESVITALLLAGMLDPNCVPRHRVHQRAFPYHAHYYHPPAQPACRDPWPEGHLQDIPLAELPRSPVPAEPPDLGHSASVIWPGYATDPPAHAPHGGPDDRTAVSVPEPSTFALLIFGIATLFALRLRPSGVLAAVARLSRAARRPSAPDQIARSALTSRSMNFESAGTELEARTPPRLGALKADPPPGRANSSATQFG